MSHAPVDATFAVPNWDGDVAFAPPFSSDDLVRFLACGRGVRARAHVLFRRKGA